MGKAKREANAKLANALKKTIRFDPNKTTLRKSSYATLNGVAKTLSQFPWLEVNIIGHSTARGYHCKRLTKGRASTVIKYLVGKGAKNKMNPKSQCGKMIGVEMKAAGGNAPIPLAAIKKCKEEVASKEGKKKADEKADKAAAKKEKASKAAKEKSDKEKVKKKEKADKLEKVAKEK